MRRHAVSLYSVLLSFLLAEKRATDDEEDKKSQKSPKSECSYSLTPISQHPEYPLYQYPVSVSLIQGLDSDTSSY